MLLYGGVTFDVLLMVRRGRAGEMVSPVRVTVLSLRLLLASGSPPARHPSSPQRTLQPVSQLLGGSQYTLARISRAAMPAHQCDESRKRTDHCMAIRLFKGQFITY